MLIFVIGSKDGYLGFIFPINMIRKGSSGFVGEKMLLGKHGSDLFGNENPKGVLKVIQGCNCLALSCTSDQTYVKK